MGWGPRVSRLEPHVHQINTTRGHVTTKRLPLVTALTLSWPTQPPPPVTCMTLILARGRRRRSPACFHLLLIPPSPSRSQLSLLLFTPPRRPLLLCHQRPVTTANRRLTCVSMSCRRPRRKSPTSTAVPPVSSSASHPLSTAALRLLPATEPTCKRLFSKLLNYLRLYIIICRISCCCILFCIY
jgi:hypothetical protein